MNFGVPYMGSKNAFAEDLVKCLPRCGRFLDACCGGGAILQASAMSGRFDHVVGNDRNPAIIKLLDAVFLNKGQIDYEHPSPCSRDEFFLSLQRIENGEFTIDDCVNKYCGSFGNDGQTYLYGADLEGVKVCAERMLTADSLSERKSQYRRFINYFIDGNVNDERLTNIQSLTQIERLQRLECIERLSGLERLQRLDCKNIFEIDFSEFDVVYFDIPYKSTSKYDFKFDYDRFYNLFQSLTIPAFLSEYDAPFTCVASFDKRQLKSRTNTGKIEGLEKLYFNGSLERYRELMGREFRPDERNQQQVLF